MKFGILGTGNVGDAIGSKLASLGHDVMMGSRTSGNEKALAFVAKNADHTKSGTFEEAAAFGEIVFNCTKGEIALEVIAQVADAIKGKILIDVTNPLDFSNGMPPCLIPELSNTNSLGEEIQRRHPEVDVVKTLNTMWCGLMVNPTLIGDGNHVNYICGNNQSAKDKVKTILQEFSWKKENLLDLGDITNARATEAVLPIWLRVWSVTRNGTFNFRIIS
jgi:predicted dinucleotide-binding enzyme